jgi:rubrerythrin
MQNPTPQDAAPELGAIEVHGTTRGAFIVRGALATASLYGAGAAGSFVAGAFAQSGGSDLDVLNFALTLEYLESAFYKEARSKAGLSGDTLKLANEIGKHEDQHVQALSGAITKMGGTPVKAPKVSFPLTDRASFLKLAQTFEDTGVSAYNGAAPSIKSKELLAVAGSIVQVEARHAAAIRGLAGKDPAPVAFDPALKKDDVLKAVKPFITG